LLRFLEDITGRLTIWLAWIAGVTLVAMMLVTVANMFLRQVAEPFGATVEVVAWLAAVTTALSLAYSQVKRAHISIDMVTARFPRIVRLIVANLMLLVSDFLFLLATWKMVTFALDLREIGTVSNTLLIPYWPIVLVSAFGVAFFSWRLLLDILQSIKQGAKS
jgi:TRAP-type C4-dicarboxylate transport system permease small subunit